MLDSTRAGLTHREVGDKSIQTFGDLTVARVSVLDGLDFLIQPWKSTLSAIFQANLSSSSSQSACNEVDDLTTEVSIPFRSCTLDPGAPGAR